MTSIVERTSRFGQLLIDGVIRSSSVSTFGWLLWEELLPIEINYCTRSEERLIEQFKDKPQLLGLLCALASPFQELETVWADLTTKRWLVSSEGVQLDGIGEIVGLSRLGLADADYRTALAFQIILNQSNGEPETIIALANQATGCDSVQLKEQFPAKIILNITNPTTLPINLKDQILEALPAGVGLTLTISGTDPFVFGPDGSMEWILGTGVVNNAWNGAAYGNGVYVAIATSGFTSTYVQTSVDGHNWTAQTAINKSWKDITFANGLFVVVGSGSTTESVMTSPDGINWTLRTSPSRTWDAITFGNGLFVAVGQSGTGDRVMTSPDGFNWTLQTSADDRSWSAVTFGNGLFVAICFDGSGNNIMTSPDGINWTLQVTPGGNNWIGVAYGNNVFVAVGFSGFFDDAMTSPDGINWTLQTMPNIGANWRDIAFGNDVFVAVAQTGGTGISTSPDGVTWTVRTNPTSILRFVDFGNNLFISGSVSTRISCPCTVFPGADGLGYDEKGYAPADGGLYTEKY